MAVNMHRVLSGLPAFAKGTKLADFRFRAVAFYPEESVRGVPSGAKLSSIHSGYHPFLWVTVRVVGGYAGPSSTSLLYITVKSSTIETCVKTCDERGKMC